MRCVVYCPSVLISNIKVQHLILSLLVLIITGTLAQQSTIERKFTDEFVLHVNDGEQAAHKLAEKYHLNFERRVN